MSHVLLFLAIKSHFLFVELSRDTSISVTLTKGQKKQGKKVPEGEGCNWRRSGVGAKGQTGKLLYTNLDSFILAINQFIRTKTVRKELNYREKGKVLEAAPLLSHPSYLRLISMTLK